MKKYYTRACNFYYGISSRNLIKKKLAYPLCGSKDIAFDKIEIFIRSKKKVYTNPDFLKVLTILGIIISITS